MKKSLSKRIRFTRRGKMVRRLMGVNHFRTRKSRKQIQQKQKGVALNYPVKKIFNY